MSAHISDEIKKAIQRQPGKPLKVIDPETGAVYFLVTDRDFSLMEGLLSDVEVDVTATYGVQDAAAGVAWNDPQDAAYDRYPEDRAS